ncbi:MAG: hypothetical protein MUF61_01105 [archaeon]|jgi:hypothetical protein|nr:hypothetical protein [archaeon]
MKVVEIKKPALVQMIAAVYEPIKPLECTGLLGGEMNGDRIKVRLAQPAQIVDRRPASVDYANEWKRIRDLISRSYDFLGGFHSHLRTIVQEDSEKRIDLGTVGLSETDTETMKDEYPRGIEIVIAMNPSRRKIPARVSDYRIIGYLAGRGKRNYRLEIGAYYLDGSLRKRRAELHVQKRVMNSFFC